jgi:exodeoxyribonuclease III
MLSIPNFHVTQNYGRGVFVEFSLATWNINSVRLRSGLIEHFINTYQPDILCLQEIKCREEQFPYSVFSKLGYQHHAVHGQKGYHGVATISKIPFGDITKHDFCNKGDARHIAVTLEHNSSMDKPLKIHNFYVPAGGDEPDPEKNEKFAHKLSFLNEMADLFSDHDNQKNNRMMLVGDLNIAPMEHDVWSHKKLLRVVSHTPIEIEHLKRVQASHAWTDAMRVGVSDEEKLYTWWSYRAKDWQVADKGRRLDHIWHTPTLDNKCQRINIIRDARGWERPSDHAPVLAHFSI